MSLMNLIKIVCNSKVANFVWPFAVGLIDQANHCLKLILIFFFWFRNAVGRYALVSATYRRSKSIGNSSSNVWYRIRCRSSCKFFLYIKQTKKWRFLEAENCYTLLCHYHVRVFPMYILLQGIFSTENSL